MTPALLCAIEAMEEAIAVLESYADVVDGHPSGTQRPNAAMRAQAALQGAVDYARREIHSPLTEGDREVAADPRA